MRYQRPCWVSSNTSTNWLSLGSSLQSFKWQDFNFLSYTMPYLKTLTPDYQTCTPAYLLILYMLLIDPRLLDKNLHDVLVRSKLSPILEDREPTERPDKKCTNRKCRYCPLLNMEGHIVASVTSRKYRTKHNVTCKSNNLVYCITCQRCKKQYVGQTKNGLK